MSFQLVYFMGTKYSNPFIDDILEVLRNGLNVN